MSEKGVEEKNGPAEDYNDTAQKEELPSSKHSSQRMQSQDK